MTPYLKLTFVLPIVCMILTSCEKIAPENPNPSHNQPPIANNQPPIANAGGDQIFTLPTDSTLLNGSLSSDPDGTIVSYQWTPIAGPLLSTIISPHLVQTKVKGLIQGVYRFELKLTDNGGLSAKDTVHVSVKDTMPVSVNDSLTGREFIFNDLIWQFDLDGAGNLYIGIEDRSDLFSSARAVEVFIKSITDNHWVVAEKYHYPNSSKYVYSIYSRSLFVFPYPLFPWSAYNQLAGTKVSLRVKFL